MTKTIWHTPKYDNVSCHQHAFERVTFGILDPTSGNRTLCKRHSSKNEDGSHVLLEEVEREKYNRGNACEDCKRVIYKRMFDY